jgi:hypothetical protein
VVEDVFVLKDDLSDWKEKNKRAVINSYRTHREELLAQTDWTQADDCPLNLHMKERYRAYCKFLRDFLKHTTPKNGRKMGKRGKTTTPLAPLDALAPRRTILCALAGALPGVHRALPS